MGAFQACGRLAIPFAGMIQIRFNGYDLRLLATPAITDFWLEDRGAGVKAPSCADGVSCVLPGQKFPHVAKGVNKGG
jgi:hypothetical protein